MDTERHLFTPHVSKTKERLQMFLSREDIAKIKRGKGWKAIVTDLDTGKVYSVRAASCGLRDCFCDAIVKEQIIREAAG